MELYEEVAKYQISKEEQMKLYWRWKFLKCEKSKTLLANSLLTLVLKIVSKFLKRHQHITDLSELLAEGYIATHKAIELYNGRSQLSTFVYLMVTWRLKEFLRDLHNLVKITQHDKRKLNIKYIELDSKIMREDEVHIYFIDTETPLTKLMKEYYIKEGSKVLEELPKTYISKVEKGKMDDYIVDRARKIYEEMEA